jgi:hypothetical protein
MTTILRGPRRVAPLCAALTLLSGCGRPADTDRYVAPGGRVISVLPNTGEMVVRPFAGSNAPAGSDAPLSCVITKDSELYVNDRFSVIEEISPGDWVELVGYWDRSPPLERFVVSYAYVRRTQTPASSLAPGATP